MTSSITSGGGVIMGESGGDIMIILGEIGGLVGLISLNFCSEGPV